jgi:hypothetical protein
MTEPATDISADIPPWSALAERERAGGTLVGGPGPGADPTSGNEDDRSGGPPRRGTSLLAAVAGGLGALVVVVALSSALGGSDPAPTTTTPVRAPLPATSPGDPAPVGTRVALGNGWTVVVLAFDPEPRPAVRNRDPDAPPLAEGQRHVLISLEMSYVDGPLAAQSPFDGVDLSVLDADGNVTTPADTPCTPDSSAFDMMNELDRGRAERGRICFGVDAELADSLVLGAAPSMTFGARPSYFALTAED